MGALLHQWVPMLPVGTRFIDRSHTSMNFANKAAE